MRAEVIAPNGFRCAPKGHTIVTFKLGAIIEGNAAIWAVDAGAAVWLPAEDDREIKVVTAPERKRRGRRAKREQ